VGVEKSILEVLNIGFIGEFGHCSKNCCWRSHCKCHCQFFFASWACSEGELPFHNSSTQEFGDFLATRMH